MCSEEGQHSFSSCTLKCNPVNDNSRVVVENLTVVNCAIYSYMVKMWLFRVCRQQMSLAGFAKTVSGLSRQPCMSELLPSFSDFIYKSPLAPVGSLSTISSTFHHLSLASSLFFSCLPWSSQQHCLPITSEPQRVGLFWDMHPDKATTATSQHLGSLSRCVKVHPKASKLLAINPSSIHIK